MIQVRTGAFETNSSSMHSLIIMDGMKPEGRINTSVWEGEAHIRENAFERYPFMLLSDWLDKAAYYIADNNDCVVEHVDEVVDRVLNLIHDRHPETNKVSFNRHVKYEWSDEQNKFVKTENDIPDYGDDDRWWIMTETYGYVDHQSEGMVTRLIERGVLTLEEFLFDPSYIVVVDGDEYCTFDHLKDSGIIDASRIRKEYKAG